MYQRFVIACGGVSWMYCFIGSVLLALAASRAAVLSHLQMKLNSQKYPFIYPSIQTYEHTNTTVIHFSVAQK